MALAAKLLPPQWPVIIMIWALQYATSWSDGSEVGRP